MAKLCWRNIPQTWSGNSIIVLYYVDRDIHCIVLYSSQNIKKKSYAATQYLMDEIANIIVFQVCWYKTVIAVNVLKFLWGKMFKPLL